MPRIYLDNAATSFPKPDIVYQAVDHWLRNGSALGRGNHQGSEDAAVMGDNCRQQMSRLLGVPSPSQVVFTLNCTDSLNLVLQGFLNSGDRVLASAMDHNSVLRPLEALRQMRGITYELIDFDPDSGLLNSNTLAAHLSASPVRLVVLTHASNVTGTIQPIQELTRMAHAAGAAVLLDAAQTAGHIPLNMSELNVDFLAAAGHKGLLGPLGMGLLCIRKGRELELHPLRFGGTGTISESLDQPAEMPFRFESGNMNVPGIAGQAAAAEWIQQQTVDAIHARIQQISVRLYDGLKSIPGVQLLTNQMTENVGIVPFNVQDQDCREVAMILDQSFQIQCRAGLHCAPLAHKTLGTLKRGGTVRFSPGCLTTDAEISAAIEAVHAIAMLS